MRRKVCLRLTPAPLSSREVERRLVVYGPNELVRRGRRRWPRELANQLTHPLALLLWVASVLALAAGAPVLAAAIVAVIVLNALFAFAQERQAEHAVEALAGYLPAEATVVRDGQRRQVEAAELVPGDVLALAEGDRIPADVRLLDGGLEIDLSTLTGESQPVYRSAEFEDTTGALIEARNVVFSGSGCVGGEATGLVVGTGMHTELGRIAALSERLEVELSPLEQQVRRVAWLISLVAVIAGLLPLGWLAAGLPLQDAFNFAIGLIVANVPEGLLPTITLALALGVGILARSGALIKRLSAVETLGSTTVICTDKTGTLTENRMRAVRVWTPLGELDLDHETGVSESVANDPALGLLGRAIAASSTAELAPDRTGKSRGEATEIGLLETARALGVDIGVSRREHLRHRLYRFDPKLRLMSTVDEREDGSLTVHAKGAPGDPVPVHRLGSRRAAALAAQAPFRPAAGERRAVEVAVPDAVTIVAHRRGSTNDELARAWRAAGIETRILTPDEAMAEVEPGDVVLARLDVLDSLDGIEPGLEQVGALVRRGARLLNPPEALRAAHDKLETSKRLKVAGLPHPVTVHVTGLTREVELVPPVVVKPRHGSWGRDVFRCLSEDELASCLAEVRSRSWFRRHGALVQELLPLAGFDLRLIVAGGKVVGAAERVARPGEWRTNISLGGRLRSAAPSSAAAALGVAAAEAIGADLVGVDLAPTDAGYVVIELNGAVDFDDKYWLEGTDVYAEIAEALDLARALPV